MLVKRVALAVASGEGDRPRPGEQAEQPAAPDRAGHHEAGAGVAQAEIEFKFAHALTVSAVSVDGPCARCAAVTF